MRLGEFENLNRSEQLLTPEFSNVPEESPQDVLAELMDSSIKLPHMSQNVPTDLLGQIIERQNSE